MSGDAPPKLGMIFDQDAALYDAVRPTYPDVLFERLQDVAGLGPGSRVLEIGAGTGQATVSLAERGYRVVALEPGPSMAEIAQRNLRTFPLATVEVATFEAWPLPPEPFDAVVAATSFHWVDPAIRVSKAAEALRIGGTLAVLSTHHVAGGDEDFFVQVQSCYERFDPSTPEGLRLPREADVPPGDREIEGSGMFGRLIIERVGWEHTYTTQEYLRSLMTYSGHRALQREAREGLLDCISGLIDGGFGGTVTKRYLFELAMAPRVSPTVQRQAPRRGPEPT